MDFRVGLLTANSLLDVIPLAQLLDDGAQLRLLFDDRFRYFCVRSGGHSIAASGREPPWVGRTFANLPHRSPVAVVGRQPDVCCFAPLGRRCVDSGVDQADEADRSRDTAEVGLPLMSIRPPFVRLGIVDAALTRERLRPPP